MTPALIRAANELELVSRWMTPFLRITAGAPKRRILDAFLAPVAGTVSVTVQLMGTDPAAVAASAAALAGLGVRAFNLNFGCPSRQVTSGGAGGGALRDPAGMLRMAEAVKAGLLADPELFAIFEKGDIDTQISEIIYRSLRFKKNVVEQDETERGMRKALNFGHTIGHGIEAVKGIKGRRTVGLFHGECVALGMLPMIESKALQKRVRAVYRRIGLPTRTTYNKEKVLAEMLHDKKAQGGQITVIKVPGLGCWRAETIPVEGLRPLLGVEE